MRKKESVQVFLKENKSEYGEIATNGTLRRALLARDMENVGEIADRDFALLNETVYGDYRIFRNRVLLRYHQLKELSERGSSVASSIVIDIETAIKFAKFEPKEQKILNMWMDGYTQTEIAEAVYDYQPNVNKAINKCIRRLQYILLYLNPYS